MKINFQIIFVKYKIKVLICDEQHLNNPFAEITAWLEESEIEMHKEEEEGRNDSLW